jgi:hypothetical protein
MIDKNTGLTSMDMGVEAYQFVIFGKRNLPTYNILNFEFCFVEVRERIKATIKNDGPIPAARQLLDALLSCGMPYVYGRFLDILREAGEFCS